MSAKLTLADVLCKFLCSILDDVGGAFGMGAVGGGLWHLLKGMKNSPSGHRFVGGIDVSWGACRPSCMFLGVAAPVSQPAYTRAIRSCVICTLDNNLLSHMLRQHRFRQRRAQCHAEGALQAPHH